MKGKVHAPISKVTINSPVFKDEVFSPTLINYFYGKNGTGKSTIARQIGKEGKTEWNAEINPDNFEVQVYNEEFIQENIQSYGNIPSVFTITKQNADIKAEIDKKSQGLQIQNDAKVKFKNEISDKQNALNKLEDNFKKTIWSKTETVRKSYSKTQSGYTSSRQRFIERLLTITPSAVDENVLKNLYNVAYGSEDVRYKELQLVSTMSIPSSPLLKKHIVSSSHTDFADFLKALNAIPWVSQGHRDYQHIAGDKCPYCQQKLPNTFENDLASCFDEQYKKEVKQLQDFIQAYKTAMNNFYSVMNNNTKNNFACAELADYSTNFDLFMEKSKANVYLLNKKNDNPTMTIELEDLSGLLKKLDEIAEQINQKIRQNNAVLDNKPAKQKECDDMVWSLMASQCQAEIDIYKSNRSKLKTEISDLDKNIKTADDDISILRYEIANLNKKTVNTTDAKNSINALIKSTGLQGFHLIEKPGAQYVYQLVRDDNKVAKGLSEGERNFIAFLYFYHTVMGSQTDEGEIRDKIVIIDDPVSSMDSSTLFTVATLVREMIAVCYNNYEPTEKENVDDHIKQIFCLTHNAFFFKEIVYNRIDSYECVSLYEIKKRVNNHSTIELCEQEGSRIGDGKINRNPVVNTYEALWREYRTSDDPVSIMNVTRRILEYYFLQMCGYSNTNIRRDLLETHRSEFETLLPDGSVDHTKYNVVDAMVSALDVSALAFNDGLYFDASAIDSALLKDAFQQIFTVLNQKQHYQMMMQET